MSCCIIMFVPMRVCVQCERVKQNPERFKKKVVFQSLKNKTKQKFKPGDKCDGHYDRLLPSHLQTTQMGKIYFQNLERVLFFFSLMFL